MKPNEHSLVPIWEKYPEIFSSDEIPDDKISILEFISEIFIPGEYYYYLIDILRQEITYQHPNITKIHGFTTMPNHLEEIINLIHPDDISFVMKAEEHCSKKMSEIGAEHLRSLKSCYWFRMRVADGSYHLFHHQAITLITDKENRVVRSLNIHTDISYLTKTNNYMATVVGFNDRNDFHQIDLSPLQNNKGLILTNRELQILPYIAQGMTSSEIAQQLEISSLTVRVHRKNILRKTDTCNSSSLIKRCIELGLLIYTQIINTTLDQWIF
ncbi:LuxR C-terminal-related transcriptional regulator [Sphingobacterium sp. MYb388]|uniref:LuxR C-terminal-related transcriptional regulator n=1 Tax=Sphingobacterium sp. MYb388 TaxID=2745437 RepID=UPI00309C016C